MRNLAIIFLVIVLIFLSFFTYLYLSGKITIGFKVKEDEKKKLEKALSS